MTNEGQRLGAAVNREKAMIRDATILDWLEEGRTYADIAEELGVASDSVRTVVYRARRRANIQVRPYRAP